MPKGPTPTVFAADMPAPHRVRRPRLALLPRHLLIPPPQREISERAKAELKGQWGSHHNSSAKWELVANNNAARGASFRGKHRAQPEPLWLAKAAVRQLDRPMPGTKLVRRQEFGHLPVRIL